MGGKSKSSTATTTSTDNSSRVVDQSGNSGFALAYGDVGGNANFTMTDHGAIESAGIFASGIADKAFEFGADSLFFADAQAKRATETTLEAMNAVGTLATRQAADQMRTLETVGELAETFRSDGTSRDRKTALYLGGGALVVVVIVAGMMLAYQGKKS